MKRLSSKVSKKLKLSKSKVNYRKDERRAAWLVLGAANLINLLVTIFLWYY